MGVFWSLKSIRRKTEAVFKSDSRGVKKPKTRIPEIKPLKATPGKTKTASEKSALNMTLKKIIKTTDRRACMIDAKTMSIRLSILRTILDAETQVARVKRKGTSWVMETWAMPV